MQEIEKTYLEIISNNIRIQRENAKISQETLAELVDCSREFINRIENQKENPSLKMLIKIAAILKVSPKSFFEKD